MKETELSCPKCGEEIVFHIECGAGFQGFEATALPTEFQPFCKCSFTDEELDELEEEAVKDYDDDPS